MYLCTLRPEKYLYWHLFSHRRASTSDVNELNSKCTEKKKYLVTRFGFLEVKIIHFEQRKTELSFLQVLGSHEFWIMIFDVGFSYNTFFITEVGKYHLLMSQDPPGNDPRVFYDFVFLGSWLKLERFMFPKYFLKRFGFVAMYLQITSTVMMLAH